MPTAPPAAHRRRIALVVAVCAVGAMVLVLLVAALVLVHGASTLPAPTHPGAAAPAHP